MINSREEYEFVNIDEGIKINGEIMPLREEERKNDLRGEDPAFLMEAQGERQEAMWGVAYPKKEMTKEILGSRLQGIVKQMATDANLTQGLTYAASFIKEQLPTADTYGLATKNVAKELGLIFTAADFKAKAYNFEAGGVLKRQHMENLFADTDMMRIPYLLLGGYYPNSEDFFQQLSFTFAINKGQVGLDYQYEPTTYANEIYRYYAWGEQYQEDQTTKIKGAWYEAVANGGNVSYDLKDIRAKWMRPVTRTICVCHTRVQYRKGGEHTYSQDDESNYFDIFSCPSTQTGHIVTLDVPGLVSGAKRFAKHYNFVKKQWPFYGEQSAIVQLAHIIPVCEMGDHTRWNSPETA